MMRFGLGVGDRYAILIPLGTQIFQADQFEEKIHKDVDITLNYSCKCTFWKVFRYHHGCAYLLLSFKT